MFLLGQLAVSAWSENKQNIQLLLAAMGKP